MWIKGDQYHALFFDDCIPLQSRWSWWFMRRCQSNLQNMQHCYALMARSPKSTRWCWKIKLLLDPHWALWFYGHKTYMGNPTFERLRFSQVHPGTSHQKLISSLRFLLRLGSQEKNRIHEIVWISSVNTMKLYPWPMMHICFLNPAR